jgi:alpha-tubulin suppressor-like RCC1 family protein
LSVGNAHICLLSTAGAAYCWGTWNYSGLLGIGSVLEPTTPTPVAGGLTFLSLETFGRDAILGHSCGVTPGGVAYCWGQDSEGQLGIAAAPDTCTWNSNLFACALNPQQVATSYSFGSVTPGRLHTCGLTTDGHAACWGRNAEGQLGDGTTTPRSTPAYAALPGTASIVSTGGNFSCAATTTNDIYCWGENIRGELGIGSTSGTSTTPVKVLWGIQSVLVTPTGTTVHVGSTLQMAATVTLDPTASGTPTIAWSSSDNSKATVNSAGLVMGVAVGPVGIRATATLGTSTASGTAALNVVP